MAASPARTSHRCNQRRPQVMRPVIGITTYVEQARWGVWEQKAVVLPYTYVQAVTDSGARAVLLPPDSTDADVVRRLDGLVIAGGADVAPDRYGAPDVHERTVVRPDRDASELALLRAALDEDLPVLGVCRGMQLMTVAYGGTLHQHLPDRLGSTLHQPAPGVVGSHGATFVPGSLIAAILGEHAEVNTYHHQGVDDPGGLTVTGRAEDGLIEVVEDTLRRVVLGVQWHPESLAERRLFAAFAAAASGAVLETA